MHLTVRGMFVIFFIYLCRYSHIFLMAAFASSIVLAAAVPNYTTYQARILKPDNSFLEEASVNFTFTILNPAANCVLHVETFSNIDMTDSAGNVSFVLGTGVQSYISAGHANMIDIFDNNQAAPLACQGGGTYSPANNDSRKIVMAFQISGFGWQVLPAMAINSVPYANYANKSSTAVSATFATSATSALSLNGYTETDFATSAGLVDCTGDDVLTYTATGFACVPQTGASGTALSINVTAPISNTGTTSSPILSIAMANSTNNGYLSSTDWITFNNKLSATSAAITTVLGAQALTVSSTITLLGDVTGPTTSNTVVTVGGKSAAQISTSVDDTLAASSTAAASTIAKRDGFGNIQFNNIGSNIISANGFNLFNGSNSISFLSPVLASSYTLTFPVSSGSAGQVLTTNGFGVLSWSDPNAGSVLSVTGTAGEVSVTGSASSPVVGLADNGVTSGTYTKLTVDSKGRVSSGTSLAAADIPNLDTSKLTTGTLPFSRGGTGLNVSGTANQILGMNATQTALEYKTVSAGANVLITNNAGELVISAAVPSGSVTSVSATAPLVSTGGATPTLSISQATSATDGYLSFVDWNLFNNKLTTLDLGSVSATGTLAIARLPSLAGDISSVSGSNNMTVNYVGGLSSATIATAIIQTTSSSSLNVSNTIVKRDASGNFAASQGIFENSVVIKDGVIGGAIGIYAPTGFTGYNLTLPSTSGTVGQVLTANGAGVLSWSNPAAPVSASQWTTSGTSIFYNTGNVGIGVSSPTNKLDISGGLSAQFGLFGETSNPSYLEGTNSVTIFSETQSYLRVIGTRSSASQMYGELSFINAETGLQKNAAISAINGSSNPENAASLLFSTRDGGVLLERMRIDQFGRVGMGTANPGATLDVSGTLKFAGSTTPVSGGVLTSDASGIATWRLPASVSASQWTTSGTNIFYNTGNVGVGVSSPQASMHVISAGLNDSGVIRAQSTVYPSIVVHNGTNGWGWGMDTVNSGEFKLGYGTTVAGSTSFMTVTTGGNVGIGTSVPTSTLQVSGTLRFAGATTPVSGGVLTSDASGIATWRLPASGGSSSFSSLTSATTTNTIDNANFTQIWNWSSLTTENALSISASAITTGSLLNLTTSSTSFNSTNGLLYVGNTAAPSSGVVARIQSNSGANSGLTVLANGNVGIATANPTSRLHVVGSTNAVYGLGNRGVYGESGCGGGGPGVCTGIYGQAGNGSSFSSGVYANSPYTGGVHTNYGLYATAAGSISYGVYGVNTGSGIGGFFSSTSGYALLTGSGSVGVGTSSPAARLDVSGTLRFAGSTTPVSGGVLTSDADGFATWRLPATASGTSQWTTSGTSLFFSDGNVGIGTTSPSETLHVSGTIKAQGQIIGSSYSTTSNNIDWDNANSISTSYDCASSINFNNIRDGGNYTLVVTGVGTTQCIFNEVTTGDDAATVSYRYVPANAARVASSHTMYSLMRVGNIVYVSWITGF